MNKISVILPTHNRPKLLKEALYSLCQQSLQPDEIIIIDDASDPPVHEKALRDEFGINIRVLRNDITHGLAWVRHQGVEATTADYITHLDDDDLLAPEAIKESLHALENNPSIDVLFLGVQGFGNRADYFNNVQPTAVDSVIKHGHGKRLADNMVHFEGQLFEGLLRSAPMAFQRIMVRREIWDSVSAFRRRAYSLDNNASSEEDARRRIKGPLRDSEWALYASVICQHTALLDYPLYLQRCEGQGMVSQATQKVRHIIQRIQIRENLFIASQRMEEFIHWKSAIRNSMSKTYFDTAYHYFYHGDRLQAWKFLKKAILTKPMLVHAKFFLRTCFPRRRISD